MKLDHLFITERFGNVEFTVGKSTMKCILTDDEHDRLIQAIRPIYARALERFHRDVKSELIEAPRDITPAPVLIEATSTDEDIPF